MCIYLHRGNMLAGMLAGCASILILWVASLIRGKFPVSEHKISNTFAYEWRDTLARGSHCFGNSWSVCVATRCDSGHRYSQQAIRTLQCTEADVHCSLLKAQIDFWFVLYPPPFSFLSFWHGEIRSASIMNESISVALQIQIVFNML